MIEQEIYDGVIVNGTTDFLFVAETLRRHGVGWCVVGDFAVNCYVRPVYTANFDLVVLTPDLEPLLKDLRAANFQTRQRATSVCAWRRIRFGERASHKMTAQFITDCRYQTFVKRANQQPIFGIDVPVAALADVVQSELWKWNGQTLLSTDKIKAQMNLLRLAEARFTEVAPLLPDELHSQAEASVALPDNGWGENFRLDEELAAL